MQRCLLEGHKPVRMKGVGAYDGRAFFVCTECNATWVEDPEPARIWERDEQRETK